MYSPRNILVTGGAGFIGSHAAVHLARTHADCRVIVLDKLDPCASVHNLSEAWDLPNFKFVKGDIQSSDHVAYVLKTYEIDTVLHFAAQTHVDNSFGNSLEFTMNNTYGTHVLLEACRHAEPAIRRFINVSTDEVYGESCVGGDADAIREDGSCLAPTNPYSAAKVGAEMLCRAYITSYRLPIIITRGNNVYGPRQYPEKAVPKFILRARRGMSLPIHGDGTSLRSFLYIDDVVSAFDCILHRGKIGEIYNIGTEQERSVLFVARDILARTGSASRIEFVEDRAFNDRRYFIGSQKLHQLGWTQRVDWQTGLQKTIDWYTNTDVSAHWPGSDIEAALAPHVARA